MRNDSLQAVGLIETLHLDFGHAEWSLGLYPTTIHNRYLKFGMYDTDPEGPRNSGKTVWPVSSNAL